MKNERQATILDIVTHNVIRTQEELIRALQTHGLHPTQATVSRDIKELRLHKITTKSGEICYAPLTNKQDERLQIENGKYQNVLSEVLLSAVPAGNIGVVKVLSGTANAAAAALEKLEAQDLIGTLAGDDTILTLFADHAKAAAFCRKIGFKYIKEMKES